MLQIIRNDEGVVMSSLFHECVVHANPSHQWHMNRIIGTVLVRIDQKWVEQSEWQDYVAGEIIFFCLSLYVYSALVEACRP